MTLATILTVAQAGCSTVIAATGVATLTGWTPLHVAAPIALIASFAGLIALAVKVRAT